MIACTGLKPSGKRSNYLWEHVRSFACFKDVQFSNGQSTCDIVSGVDTAVAGWYLLVVLTGLLGALCYMHVHS